MPFAVCNGCGKIYFHMVKRFADGIITMPEHITAEHFDFFLGQPKISQSLYVRTSMKQLHGLFIT